MGIEPKKIVKLICTNQNQYDILTEMPHKEIIAEVEYNPKFAGPERDPKWCRLEGLTPSDEKVPAAVIREDIRGYLIIPFHPSQNMAPQVQPAERAGPRILQ